MKVVKTSSIWKYAAGAVIIGCLGIAVMTQAGKGVAGKSTQKVDAAVKTRAVQMLGSQPLHFEANQGQTAGQVKFLSRGQGYNLFLTATESIINLNREEAKATVRMAWKGADPNARMTGLDQLAGKSNY